MRFRRRSRCLSGDDAVTLAFDRAGRRGIISVASNEIPREMADMTRAALGNDWDNRPAHPSEISAADAGQLHRVQSMPVKAVLAMMGKIEEVYRLPMLPMRRDTRSKLQKIAAESGLIAKPAAPEAADFMSTKTGWPGHTRSSCTAPPAANAITAKDARQGTTPTTPAGMAPTQALSEAREASHQLAGRVDPQRVQMHLVRDCRF